jgi:hypothetical protein
LIVLLAGASAPARAQESFDASLQVSWARSNEFDTTRAGIGGRVAWHPLPLIGTEAELAFYPGDFADGPAFSKGQTEALFGVTVGPQLGPLRPFGKFRGGVLRLAEAPGPIACIAIFPPPLSCQLAAGDTLPAVEYGGGIEVAAGRAFFRIEIADRPVKYSAPVIDERDQVRNQGFWSHDLRTGLGVGVRF